MSRADNREELTTSSARGERQLTPFDPTRREFLVTSGKFGLAIAAGGVLAACQSTSASKTASKTMTVASPYIAQNLDRESNGSDALMQELNTQIVEPLLQWKRTRRPDGAYDLDFSGYDPVLAESWEISNGGKTCTFNLRQGVKSPKGNELTAEVLKWNYDRYLTLKGSGAFHMGILGVTSPDEVVVLSKYSMSVSSTQPSNLWLSIQPQFFLGPLDAVEYMAHGTTSDPFAQEFGKQNVVGFGPYQIESRVVGQQAVLVPNPNYWRKSPPPIERLVFKEVPQDAIRYSLLVSGDVDMARSLSFTQLGTLAGKPGVKVYNFLSGDQVFFPIQTEHKNLSDKRVRQAMSWALPYDDIVNKIYAGIGSKMYGPLPQSFPGFGKSLWPYSQDLDKAKSLLREAGLASGFSTTMSYVTYAPEDEPLAFLMQSAFKQIGIEAQLIKETSSAHSQALNGGTFDIAEERSGSNDPDQFYTYSLLYAKTSNINYGRWKNDEASNLMAQGLVSQDAALRQQWGSRIQAIINDEVPALFIAEPGLHYGVRSNISGLLPRLNRELFFADIIKS